MVAKWDLGKWSLEDSQIMSRCRKVLKDLPEADLQPSLLARLALGQSHRMFSRMKVLSSHVAQTQRWKIKSPLKNKGERKGALSRGGMWYRTELIWEFVGGFIAKLSLL